MTKTETICRLNDAFRSSFMGGRLLVTPGIADRADANAILEKVRSFNQFSEDNDPYGEHDFGALDWDAQKVFWKIDYYDADLSGGSPDPSDPAVTTRVLTVMLAEEY